MNIPINKDFEHDYKSSVWKGFTLVEMVHLCIGVSVAVGLCLLLWLVVKLPVVPSIYISIPVGFPILASGFWKSVNGLNLWQYRKAIRYRKATRILYSRAGEYRPVPDTFSEIDMQRKEAQKNKIRKMKKLHRKTYKKIKKRKLREAYEDQEAAVSEETAAIAAAFQAQENHEREGTEAEIYLNPFEIPEEVLTDPKMRDSFIIQKTDFLENFMVSCGAADTEMNKALVGRCVKRLYDQVFQKKEPRSPILEEFCRILQEQLEPEAKELYAALEAYVNGTYQIFNHDSSPNINDRVIVEGKRNLPSAVAETYMLTAMHLLSIRMGYKTSVEEKS